MSDLFLQRVRVSLADAAAKLDGPLFLLNAEFGQRLSMALNGTQEVSKATMQLLSEVNWEDPRVATRMLLRAFWANYTIAPSHHYQSLLLVNPPSTVGIQAKFMMTLEGTTGGLYGHHGQTVKNRKLTSIEVAQIPSTADLSPGYFEGALIFWDDCLYGGMEILEQTLMPGSTVVTVAPSQIHRFWLGWIGVDLHKDALDFLCRHFKLRKLGADMVASGNVTVEYFGVEAL